ncbi:MAG: MBOAT family O-acyltransferase [Candidatus Krumholzibacteriia bacterium]
MLFNSGAFALFLPLVFALYWTLSRAPLRMQNALLVVASYVFYGWWDWRFLSLIAFSSTVDYVVGLGLAGTADERRRRVLLLVSLATNLGLLGVFKYYDFFIESAAELLTGIGVQPNVSTLRIILPVGISFYTFQTLSYTIDIYRRKLEPTRDAVAFFAFVSFFPQLVAGPIERASNLLPQFLRPRRFDEDAARDGVRQMVNGFLKKVVVADNLAPHVDTIFGGAQTADGLTLWIGVFFFAIQIYCDFSGYSDIALGTARLFGFELMRNFRFPYFARDIAEFWRRWHISLSTWFRDYVFIPLGGSRASTSRRILNTMITFTVSGLWHGANWTFVIWGFLNGLYYVPLALIGRHRQNRGEPAEGRLIPSAAEAASMLLTFVATLVAWVFFRADSLRHALTYLGGMFGRGWEPSALQTYAPLLMMCGLLLGIEWLQRYRRYALDIGGLPLTVRWGIYQAAILVFLVFGSFREQAFIYFQF